MESSVHIQHVFAHVSNRLRGFRAYRSKWNLLFAIQPPSNVESISLCSRLQVTPIPVNRRGGSDYDRLVALHSDRQLHIVVQQLRHSLDEGLVGFEIRTSILDWETRDLSGHHRRQARHIPSAVMGPSRANP
eukprot:6466216-Amphidinium_carterae.1